MLKELPTKQREKARRIIKATGGKFFSVTFTKRTNGQLRTMTCRTGVHKFLIGEAGKGQQYDPDDVDLICVWDPASYKPENKDEDEKGDAGYRSINLRTVASITFRGMTQTFESKEEEAE